MCQTIGQRAIYKMSKCEVCRCETNVISFAQVAGGLWIKTQCPKCRLTEKTFLLNGKAANLRAIKSRSALRFIGSRDRSK